MRGHWRNFENTRSEKTIMGSACSLILLILLVTLSGCIVSYNGFPQVNVSSNQPSNMQGSIAYHVRTDGFLADMNLPSNKRTMVKAIENQKLFSEELSTDTHPEKGRYCSIYVKWGTIRQGGGVIIFPGWSDVLYSVQYDLYNNQQRVTSGRYEFEKNTTIWAPLLPFFWVNWFNASKLDAFTATLNQFMLDAQRDGYLRD